MQAERAAGLLLVIALHGGALYWVWQQGLLPVPPEVKTVFVHFFTPPKPVAAPPVVPRKLQPASPEQPVPNPAPVLQTAAPQASAVAQVATAPAVVESTVAPAAPAKPAGPVTLSGDLALACPERSAPVYPTLSRRLGEEGKVQVRVELDEQGRVDIARVVNGSGFARLDAAALAAVRNWRCQPAQRDGRAVRAVALQPFNFMLGGN